MQIYIDIFFVIAVVANKIWKCSKWDDGIFQSTSEVHITQEKLVKHQKAWAVSDGENKLWRPGLN